MKDKTAILLFSRTPQQEIARKTFISGDKSKNLKVASSLITHAQREAEKTNLPLYTAFGNQQVGDTFGQRLANEVEKVFQNDHQQVIIIGNDCLELDADLIRKAQEKFGDGKMTLGPAADGGLYLIALDQKDFDKKKFIDLAWETERLQDSFLDYATSHSLATHLLETLEDVDDAKALSRMTDRLASCHFLKSFLLRLLQEKPQAPSFSYTFSYFKPIFLSLKALRAPPSHTAGSFCQ